MSTCVAGLVVCLVSLAGEALPAPAPTLTTEHAARLYRIETYNTLRHDRAEYERRIAAGEQVWKTFNDAGQPNAQRDEVLQWFVAARTAVQQKQALPALPQLEAIATKNAPEKAITTEIPVITSGREESPLVEAIPDGVATSLEIQLPASAEATEPAQAKFTKQVTTTVRSPDPNVEGTTAPIIVELPTGKRVDVAVETPELPSPVSAKPAKTETAPEVSPAKKPVESEDPFAVKNLFEPAAVPAPATEAATDTDPFAP